MFFLGGDLEILVFLGMFTIFFTSLAHLIVKIVTLQEGFNAGNQVNHQTTHSMFSSQRPRGNPSYDQLIRKMKLTDLSGMSVEQASSTYASFFNCGDLASKPFFSSPYVQQSSISGQFKLALRPSQGHTLLLLQQNQVQVVHFGHQCQNHRPKPLRYVRMQPVQHLLQCLTFDVSNVAIGFAVVAKDLA